MICFQYVMDQNGTRLESAFGVESEAECPPNWEDREGGAFSFKIVVSQPSDVPDIEKAIAMTGVDAATVAYVLSWGFGVVLFFWALGYGIGAALKVIRMV